MNEQTTTAEQAKRDIPLPPGGGSWRFDEDRWEWAPNSETAPEEQPAAADVAAAPIEAKTVEQSTTEE